MERQRSQNLFRPALLLTVFMLGIVSGSWVEKAYADEECLLCHGNPELQRGAPNEGEDPSVYVDGEAFKTSIHGLLECGDCHPVSSIPHEDRILPPSRWDICAGCHAGAVEEFSSSVHFGSDSVDCSSCHGPPHQILSGGNPDSPVFPRNLPKTCAVCHDDPNRTEKYHMNSNDVYGNYTDSIHGQAVSGGYLIAAHCTSCHGAHGIKRPLDPESSAHRSNVPETCGVCHSEILKTYREGIHGERFEAGLFSAPVCTDCHTAHEIRSVGEPEWKLDVVRECGNCHAESVRTFRDTFHGQVTSLGFTRVARCSDCHGSHDIQPSRDPQSRVHPDRRLETCQSCHPAATVGFSRFDPHADSHDFGRNPVLYVVAKFMVFLLVGVFSFFGLHTFLWFVRSMLERRGSGRGSRPSPGSETYYVRFNLEQRLLHGVLIVAFLGIVITGMPLLYSGNGWAAWLAHALGGFGVMGFLHRFFALVLTGLFLFHLGRIFHSVFVKKQWTWLWGPGSLIPQPRDAVDLFRNLKWFFGLGPRPRLGRFTYWEKFDYLAVFWGMPVIGITGYVLWFDEFFGRFIPGWWFNVAQVIHGEEALLAAVFIFTIHYFNTHLRPEKFPMDKVIFTGRVHEAEFQDERPEEFEALAGSGELESLRAPKPERWIYWVAWIFGGAAVAIGLGMFFLILIAVFGSGG